MAKIFIDPGHGGKDPGAIGNGIYEKDIVLDICHRIKKGLSNYENTTVNMSRETDVFLSLSERTKKANQWGADLLLSVHVNSATNKSAKGFETFRYPGANSATVAFQNVLHAEIMKSIGTGITDRGKKQKNLHMVRESLMKACLSECLFISNASDASKLKDAAFRQKLADGHINGIVAFLGLKKKGGSDPKPQQPKKETGKLYKVQVGAYSVKNNAVGMLKDLEKQKISAFITYDAEEKLYFLQAGAYSTRENAERQAEKLRKLGYRPFIKYE